MYTVDDMGRRLDNLEASIQTRMQADETKSISQV